MDDHVLNDVLNDDGNNYMNEALRGRGSPRYWFVRDCLKFYGRVILVRALGPTIYKAPPFLFLLSSQ